MMNINAKVLTMDESKNICGGSAYAVQQVSGEAGGALRDDHVDLPSYGVLHLQIEFEC